MCDECYGAYNCPMCGSGEVREEEPTGFKCDNCNEVSGQLTEQDGFVYCENCLTEHEAEMDELISQLY